MLSARAMKEPVLDLETGEKESNRDEEKGRVIDTIVVERRDDDDDEDDDQRETGGINSTPSRGW
jgi:hypothetical protein